MKLQFFGLLNKFYLFLNELVKVLNIFVFFQKYIIVKRQIKISKIEVLCKAVLIYNRSKKYIDKNRNKKNTTSQKINFFLMQLLF